MFTMFIQPEAKQYFNKVLTNNKDGNIFKLGFSLAGCNGFKYVLNIVDEDAINDTLSSKYIFAGIPFIIKNEDKNKLNNLIIDYKKDGLNYSLVYDNPNVSYECGCGESVTFK